MVAKNIGAKEGDETLPNLLRGTMAGLVRRDKADLSSRQLAIFLICYLTENSQTVRGLAETLEASRPAVSRALDRLTQFELIRRKVDPADRRSVLVQRTAIGNAFLREIRAILNVASASPLPPRNPTPGRARNGRASA